MGVSKVVFGDNTILDLTQDTVTASALSQGYTAHGADGEPIVGTGSGGSGMNRYITFTAGQNNCTISLNSVGTWTEDWDIRYSTNNQTWNKYTMGTTITLTNVDDYVSFAGIGNWTRPCDHYHYHKFQITGDVYCSGNCCGLLSQDIDGTTPYCFENLFDNCRSLITPPELPAITMNDFCYNDMFYNCTSLTTAPALPATTLSDYCYNNMFRNCTSLTTAPNELPATTLAGACYVGMFYGCTSLTTAPTLPATTLASNCYQDMFGDCTSLTTPPELPATTLAMLCYYQMFRDCTSLTTAPELPATTLAYGCYRSMFQGCTSLVTPTELPATTLADTCYREMFMGCTSLQVYATSGEGHTHQWKVPQGGDAIGSYVTQTNMLLSTIGDYSSTATIDFSTQKVFYTQNEPV